MIKNANIFVIQVECITKLLRNFTLYVAELAYYNCKTQPTVCQLFCKFNTRAMAARARF